MCSLLAFSPDPDLSAAFAASPDEAAGGVMTPATGLPEERTDSAR